MSSADKRGDVAKKMLPPFLANYKTPSLTKESAVEEKIHHFYDKFLYKPTMNLKFGRIIR